MSTVDQAVLPAGTWKVDLSESHLGFMARGVWGLVPVKGKFEQFEGELTIDGDGARGELSIVADSLNTKNKQRDKHLRSADFFDVATHPDFSFAVDGVRPVDGGVQVTGSLTVRGRTRPVSFDATVASVEGEVWLDGEVPVNRADFGLTWNMMGIASMNNTIVVHAVFTRE
jgi:polyisoprenoid-binding protein YceI